MRQIIPLSWSQLSKACLQCLALPVVLFTSAGLAQEEGVEARLAALKALTVSSPATAFETVRSHIDREGIRRHLLQFQADDLRQFALLLEPAGKAPAKGWPVLVYNHGTHPNPPQYGKNSAGEDSRPGDYYRGVAQAYARAGFAVLAPDQRGHNQSQGLSFTRDPHSNYWFARDTVLATLALSSLDQVDVSRVYMAGHSRGGRITQLASLALGERLQAASIWSTGAAQIVLGDHLSELQVPVLIQHGSHDTVTPVAGSLSLVEVLSRFERPYDLHLYDSSKHLFEGEHFEQAIKKDVHWFNAHP